MWNKIQTLTQKLWFHNSVYYVSIIPKMFPIIKEGSLTEDIIMFLKIFWYIIRRFALAVRWVKIHLFYT